MDFGNLKSDAGLGKLNIFLEDKSYINGFNPSQADVFIYKVIGTQPKSDFINVLRWYKHIGSYSDYFDTLPG